MISSHVYVLFRRVVTGFLSRQSWLPIRSNFWRKAHIIVPLGAVKVLSTILPVLRVCAGSNTRTCASSSAIVRCSTPGGTTQNSPACKFTRWSDHARPGTSRPHVRVDARKNSGEFHKLEFLAVQLGNDLRSPMFMDQTKFFLQGGFDHTLFNYSKNKSRRAVSVALGCQAAFIGARQTGFGI